MTGSRKGSGELGGVEGVATWCSGAWRRRGSRADRVAVESCFGWACGCGMANQKSGIWNRKVPHRYTVLCTGTKYSAHLHSTVHVLCVQYMYMYMQTTYHPVHVRPVTNAQYSTGVLFIIIVLIVQKRSVRRTVAMTVSSTWCQDLSDLCARAVTSNPIESQ